MGNGNLPLLPNLKYRNYCLPGGKAINKRGTTETSIDPVILKPKCFYGILNIIKKRRLFPVHMPELGERIRRIRKFKLYLRMHQYAMDFDRPDVQSIILERRGESTGMTDRPSLFLLYYSALIRPHIHTYCAMTFTCKA